MIQIKKVTIMNFRSFKNKGNILNNINKITVFVGKNNVGKTNVLRAIYLFFNPGMYNSIKDRNMIKQLTGGGSKEPKITITFIDDEIIAEKSSEYSIVCDFNRDDDKYSIKSKDDDICTKLESSRKIQKYLEGKIKCVYLATTDQQIDMQSENLINDLILEYYKKNNQVVKRTIEEFEKQYNMLLQIFSDNLSSIEDELSNNFLGLQDVGIKPKLILDKKMGVTNFLMEKIKLQLDDDYVQDINEKGAGIQRSALIMLSIYLLNQVHTNKSKIILLDEPEAFLYPLLERRIKEQLEEAISDNNKLQIFLTTHSRVFISDINNKEIYEFKYLKQLKEETNYKRSKNEVDINKYSVIEDMTVQNKNEVLNNYGLLDEINNYEYIIICEGPTDKNYIKKILEKKPFLPQIRYGKLAEGNSGNEDSLQYDYVGKGASASLSILAYLDRVSEVRRKVLVILDGDSEGKRVSGKIKECEYKHLDIKKLVLPDGKVIEDMIFSPESFSHKALSSCPQLQLYQKDFENVIKKKNKNTSLITQTDNFIKGNVIRDVNLNNLKHLLSINLTSDEINSKWLLDEVDDFFYGN